MNQSAFPSSQYRQKRSVVNEFFTAYPLGELARSLLFSSICWVLIIIAVYTVYSMALSRN